MGYYATGEGRIEVPAGNDEQLLEALKQLNHDPRVPKHGGAWSGSKQTEAWFSWMPTDYDKTAESWQEVFDLLGFELDQHGDVYYLYYDSKVGQEELFAKRAAPFITRGQVDWTGEDGSKWRWLFKDGKLEVQTGKVVYE